MLNKLKAFMADYRGQAIVCAVSGGADSMALLWGLYLLKDALDLELSAAHFNHGLRGAESDRDEAFVREFCAGYGIPFALRRGKVEAGKKGLEAAAREVRYGFLKSLPGKIATAHTADDNAETLLMHLVRGTGLKGLGGIAPVNGNLLRPMLNITRREVLDFLKEYSIPYVEDSSNAEDDFLRNRLRHRVMPLLKAENPSLSQNLSAMALRLRQDDQALNAWAEEQMTWQVKELRAMEPAIRSRVLAKILLEAGIKEPESAHIAKLEALVFSSKPSAKADFPGGARVARNYDTLVLCTGGERLEPQILTCPGVCLLPGVKITCSPNGHSGRTASSFPVTPRGSILVRSREAGDALRLLGGTKRLKKLFIDEKIPAAQRERIPVLADDEGVLGVAGFGGNLDRIDPNGAVRIELEYL